jgi:hypothetical protein
VRQVRGQFRANAGLTDAAAEAAIADGKLQLNLVKRQSTVRSLYPPKPSVMETLKMQAA